jgi:Serine/threonine protein kinase
MEKEYKLKIIGKEIENYKIEGRIWQGGTSTIYKGICEEGIYGKVVAIKVLHPYRKESYQVKIFKKEFRILKNLSHPSIIKVHRFGKKNGLYYIIMEYIDGKSLRNFYEKNSEIFPQTILYILIKVGEGIEYIHSKKIVHNDIKPENVIVGNNLKYVKIIDFGYAEKIGFFKRRDNLIGGTEKYVAPERKKGFIDLKSDIYSYCVMLEEYLSLFDFYEEIYPVINLGKSENFKKRPKIEDILDVLRGIYKRL